MGSELDTVWHREARPNLTNTLAAWAAQYLRRIFSAGKPPRSWPDPHPGAPRALACLAPRDSELAFLLRSLINALLLLLLQDTDHRNLVGN